MSREADDLLSRSHRNYSKCSVFKLKAHYALAIVIEIFFVVENF